MYFSDLDTMISECMSKDSGGNVWVCHVCQKSNKDKSRIRSHVETHFDGYSHVCTVCGRSSKSREALRKHMSNIHALPARKASDPDFR